MRLAAVCLIRDECDIVESFVRHNLTLLDRLYVLDNSSTDSTPHILQNLVAEGLPLVIVPDKDGDYYQARMTLKLMKLALNDERWDFVFPLDCDEFIQASDRRFLEAALADLADDTIGLSNYVQYIPKETDDYSEQDVVRRVVHRAEVRPKLVGKVVVPGRLVAHPEFSISEGNHRAALAGKHLSSRRVDQLDLAHFPIRSIEQFVSRAVVSHLAWISRSDYNPTWAQHFRVYYSNLKNRPTVTLTDLTEAMSYYIDSYSEGGPPDSVAVICAPFTPGYERLRYGNLIAVKILPRVMGMAEGLIEQLQHARALAQNSLAVTTVGGSPTAPMSLKGSTDSPLGPYAVIGHWNDVSAWRANHLRMLRADGMSPIAGTPSIRLVEDKNESWRNIQTAMRPRRERPIKIAAEVRFESMERQAVLMMIAGTDRFSGKLDPRKRQTSTFTLGGGTASNCVATPMNDDWWRIELTGMLPSGSGEDAAYLVIAITKDGFRENYCGDGKSGISVGTVTVLQGLPN